MAPQAAFLFARRLALPALLALLACHGPVHAEGSDGILSPSSIHAGLGPFGLGLGAGWRIDGHWATRLYVQSGTFGEAKVHTDLDDVRYETRWKAHAGLAALADYFPWQDSGWRLTGGVVLAKTRVGLQGEADRDGQYTLNGHHYSAAQVGTLTGRLTYSPVNLYLGGGWESAPLGSQGWRFVSDAGLFYSGRAKASLDASGAANDPALRADVQAARHDLRKQGLGAAITLGAAYAF